MKNYKFTRTKDGYQITDGDTVYCIGRLDCIGSNRTTDAIIIYQNDGGDIRFIGYYYGAMFFEDDLQESFANCIDYIERSKNQ